MIKDKNREDIYLIVLVLLGLYLSLIENLIPKPFPWMKIGLSNVAILIALEKFNSKMAIKAIILRVFIQALMLGTLFTPGFIISISAGTVSTFFMIFLYKFRKYLSLLSISCASAFLHNLLQLLVVYFLLFRNMSLNSKSIVIFIGIFLFLGLVTGLITGVIAEKLNLRKLKKFIE
ncbi:MAG: Gx transporter family protein [Fusobacterium sp.]|uniref:Gx transporter family protein n=1 Tax=Fusobacterium sp. TaxID=68766 RepID=UPI0026DCCD82|nr:Gx transporter family protein [Fusobacterium sp.]MDO4690493.1 Gx transporter family protein [Fusobacterium sp.]